MVEKGRLLIIWADGWPHGDVYGVYRVLKSVDPIRLAAEFHDLSDWTDYTRSRFVDHLCRTGIIEPILTDQFYLGGPVDVPELIEFEADDGA